MQTYNFDRSYARFYNILLKSDTLVLFGLTHNPEPPYFQEILVVFADTLGNVLHQTTIGDPAWGGHYTYSGTNPGCVLPLPGNDGYLFMGTNQAGDGYIVRVDALGGKVWEQDYPSASSFIDRFTTGVILDDGFLLVGSRQELNYLNVGLACRFSSSGDLMWERTYGTPSLLTFVHHIVPIEGANFMLGAFASTISNNGGLDYTIAPLFITIDSLGTDIGRWQGELSLEEYGMLDLHRDADGHWVYMTHNGMRRSDGYLYRQPRLVVRDTAFNLISTTLYDTLDYTRNRFFHFISSAYGGWIAVGENMDRREDLGYGRLQGWISRMAPAGDTLWDFREATLEIGPPPQVGSSLYAAVELPGGSVVAAGEYVVPSQGITHACLIKVDKHGCLAPGCEPITSTVAPPPMPAGSVLAVPNPASTYVDFHVSLPAGGRDARLSVLDASWRQVAEYVGFAAQCTLHWDTSGLPPGLYVYRLTASGVPVTVGRVAIVR